MTEREQEIQTALNLISNLLNEYKLTLTAAGENDPILQIIDEETKTVYAISLHNPSLSKDVLD